MRTPPTPLLFISPSTAPPSPVDDESFLPVGLTPASSQSFPEPRTLGDYSGRHCSLLFSRGFCPIHLCPVQFPFPGWRPSSSQSDAWCKCRRRSNLESIPGTVVIFSESPGSPPCQEPFGTGWQLGQPNAVRYQRPWFPCCTGADPKIPLEMRRLWRCLGDHRRCCPFWCPPPSPSQSGRAPPTTTRRLEADCRCRTKWVWPPYTARLATDG